MTNSIALASGTFHGVIINRVTQSRVDTGKALSIIDYRLY